MQQNIKPLSQRSLDYLDPKHEVRDAVAKFVADGFDFYVNHSGGKDSQDMYGLINTLVPEDQIVVIHADLGEEVEWAGVKEHIQDNINHPLHKCHAIWGNSTKKGETISRKEKYGERKYLLDAMEDRGMWPSLGQRYCTSDLKRTPIEKFIRAMAKERGNLKIVNCLGYRRSEGGDRKNKPLFEEDYHVSEAGNVRGLSRQAGRIVYDLHPILDHTLEDVWAVIRETGQVRHYAYDKGMSRLSCKFCIFASDRELLIAADDDPDLALRYLLLEEAIGHKMKSKTKGLVDILMGDVEPTTEGEEEVHPCVAMHR